MMSDVQTTWTDEQGETWVPFSDYMALSAKLKAERNKALREAARKLEAEIDACGFDEFDDEVTRGLRHGMYAALGMIKSLIPPEQQDTE